MDRRHRAGERDLAAERKARQRGRAVDTDGKVTYAGGRGPFFFDVKELKAAIDTELAAGADAPRGS